MAEGTDPTFYRSPAAAIAAPPEKLAYVAALDPAGSERDAMTVVDCNAESPTYGEFVGWTDLPTAGNELHHFGWNACSSALCHKGHAHHGTLERRYLVVPGLRSSRTYVLDTKPNPRQPEVVHTIEAEELAAKAGYSPHTRCIAVPAASSCPTWAAPTAPTAREGWRSSITTPSRSPARGRPTGASSTSPTTCGGTSTTTSPSRRSGRRHR